MTFAHGKETVIKINLASSPVSGAADISLYVNTSTLTREGDTHDVTTYGKDDHVFAGGLKAGGFTMGGVYDNASSGTPRAIMSDHETEMFNIVRRPEGTGSGLPQQVITGILKSYVETNPVADMVSWTAEFTKSDAIDDTAQT
ncbi:MAG TPA: hypothetical protein VFB74_29810 [Kribbellaceae bacterium]|nr:hypothetical protein [Kribbellaceae bacterium]